MKYTTTETSIPVFEKSTITDYTYSFIVYEYLSFDDPDWLFG